MLPAASDAACPYPPRRCMSNLVWDGLFTHLGYRREELDLLRDDPSLAPSDGGRMLLESFDVIADGPAWTDPTVIEDIRRDIKLYLEALEALRDVTGKRHARKFATKSFVEDTRFTALKAREVERKVSSQMIADKIKRVDLSHRDLQEIDEDSLIFRGLQELTVSHNHLRNIDFIPPALRVLLANGNCIETILAVPTDAARTRPSVAPNLVFLSVVDNRLTTLAFAAFMPSLVVLDAAYNEISALEDAADPVSLAPALSELSLVGNPVSLLPTYRTSMMQECPKLQVLDSVSSAVPVPDATLLPANASTVMLGVTLHRLKGTPSLTPAGPTPEEEAALAAAQGAAKSRARDKKSGIKTSRGSPTAAESAVGPKHEIVTVFALKHSDGSVLGPATDESSTLVPDTSAVPVPPAVEEQPVHRPGKGAKGKVPVLEPIPMLAVDEATLTTVRLVPVALSADMVTRIMAPIEIRFFLSYIGATSAADALGSFIIDTAPLVEAITWGHKAIQYENLPLVLDERVEERMGARIAEMEAIHQSLVSADATLNAVLAEMMREAATPQPTTTGKGKAQRSPAPGAVPPTQQFPPEIQAAQAEAAKRRIEIDQLAFQIMCEKKKVDKLSDIKVTLSCTVELNPLPAVVCESARSHHSEQAKVEQSKKGRKPEKPPRK